MPALQTTRLDLIPGTVDTLRAELEGPLALAGHLHGVRIPAGWPPDFYDEQAVRYSLDALLRDPRNADWGFYYIVRRAERGDRVLVGAGGFKGAPDDQGVVEIGYSILAAQQ